MISLYKNVYVIFIRNLKEFKAKSISERTVFTKV